LEISNKFKFTESLSNVRTSWLGGLDIHSPQLLLRYVDDYLFVTTELEVAKRFLDMMNKGDVLRGSMIRHLIFIQVTRNMDASSRRRRL
jgi:hypothetical protein